MHVVRLPDRPAPAGVHASTSTPDSVTIGQMIPATNNAYVNTPTATTPRSPARARRIPYAPSVKRTIDVSVSSPGPFTRRRSRAPYVEGSRHGSGVSTEPTISPTASTHL